MTSLDSLVTIPPPLLLSPSEIGESPKRVDVDLEQLGDLFTSSKSPSRSKTTSQGQSRENGQARQQQRLRYFLQRNNFKDVNDSIVVQRERLYPLHVAARLGKHKIVELLVMEGADVCQKTSEGRTPLDFAKQAPVESQSLVVGFLQSLETTMSSMTMRDFIAMKSKQCIFMEPYVAGCKPSDKTCQSM